MRASVADDAGTLRVGQVDRTSGVQGGTLQGVSPDGRVLVERDADLLQSTAVVSLEWLREVRALLGPPTTALPR